MVSGVRFRLIDGDHHIVDSSELAFMLAAQGAMKQGMISTFKSYSFLILN